MLPTSKSCMHNYPFPCMQCHPLPLTPLSRPSPLTSQALTPHPRPQLLAPHLSDAPPAHLLCVTPLFSPRSPHGTPPRPELHLAAPACPRSSPSPQPPSAPLALHGWARMRWIGHDGVWHGGWEGLFVEAAGGCLLEVLGAVFWWFAGCLV